MSLIYSFKVRRVDGLTGSGRVKAEDHRDAQNQVLKMYGNVGVSVNITLLKNQDLANKQWESK